MPFLLYVATTAEQAKYVREHNVIPASFFGSKSVPLKFELDDATQNCAGWDSNVDTAFAVFIHEGS